ncbi:MAG: uncharacterized protein A8A55_2643, partial [Amphiamblys sp. WSBS2006]
RCTKDLGRFEETAGVYIETNALVENISPGIESAREMKQKIGEMIAQKETIMKTEVGYQKLVFEEDSKHGEQSETKESSEQLSIESQMFEVFEEDHSRLKETEDMIHMLEDLFSPGEDSCSQGEEVPDTAAARRDW